MKRILLILLLLSSLVGYSQLQLPYSVKLVNPLPVDYYYGPWASVAAAKTGVPLAVRYGGQTVMVTGTGEYWWLAADLTDTGLIPKTPTLQEVLDAGSTLTNGVYINGDFDWWMGQTTSLNSFQLFSQGTVEIASTAGSVNIFADVDYNIDAASQFTVETNTMTVNINTDLGTTGEGLISDGAGGVIWGTVGGMSNPMTTGGDLIYGGASGTPTRLANGTAGQYLKSNGTTLAPSWDTPSGAGDVLGPASSTNNLVATYDGTTGKLLKSTTTPNIGTATSTGLAITSGVTTGTGSSSALNVLANSLTTGNGLDISSSSATTGNLASFTRTSTSLTNSGTTGLLKAASSGANSSAGAVSIAGIFSSTNTGSTSYNYGVVSSVSGGSYNYGIFSEASGASALNNYGIIATSSGSGTTNNYGGYFSSTGAGTNGIGGYFTSTGGTNNTAIQIGSGDIKLNTDAGTSGQVLTSQGANATPAWTTPSGGGSWSLATGGTLTGTNTITAGANPFIFSTGVTTGTGSTSGHQIVANSLTTGNVLDVSSSSVTTGLLAKYASTSTVIDHTAGTNGLVGIESSGANSTASKTAVGIHTLITNTGTSSTNVGANLRSEGATINYGVIGVGAGASATNNYGGYFNASGASATNNTAGYFLASGGTNNTGIRLQSGDFKLGSSSGTAGQLLTSAGPNVLPTWTPITGSGNAVLSTSPTLVTPILGTPTSVTLTNATGLPPTSGISGWPSNASGVLTNDGSGVLTWGGGGGSGPISGLSAATGVNTINNGAHAQEWQWNSLGSGTGLLLSSSSTAAASSTNTVFRVNQTGANVTSSQATYSGYFSNTKTGTSGTNVALYAAASGGAGNFALYTSGPAFIEGLASSDYVIYLKSGSVNHGVYLAPDGGQLTPIQSGGTDLGNSSQAFKSAYFTGNVVIGTGTAAAKLHVAGSGTTTAYNLLTENSSGTDRFGVLDNGEVQFSGSAGTSGQFLQSSGTGSAPVWAAPFVLTTTGTSGAATYSAGTLNIPQYSGGGGGITNGAAANEMMKSDGTNAVASGISSTTAGNINLGLAATSGATRTITADGSATDVALTLASKGSGNVVISSAQTNNGIQLQGAAGSSSLLTKAASIQIMGLTTGTGSVNNSFKIRHDITGTPIAGSGVGMQFESLTSTANYEVGGQIEAVTTDVTSTSEDFDLVFKAMDAGATANEKMRITSDGVISITQAATNPSGNPSGAGFLYSNGSDTNKPYWKAPSGDVYDLTNTTLGFNAQSGTTYTLALTDAAYKAVRMTNASANTITIPLNATVAYPIGTMITLINHGAGLTSVAVTGGVTLNGGTATLHSAGQNSQMVLIKYATDDWYLAGAAGGKITYDATITAGGTTGNQTIDKPSGTVNIAAAGTTVTVTNNLCTTSSIVMAVVRTNDTTAYIKNVVPGAGSFVINLGAAATAEVSIGFIVSN